MLTYHPLFKKINYIIKKHIDLLYMNETFQLGLMISFGYPRHLSSSLVRAKIYPMERKPRSSKCKGNRCQVCLNVPETETFISTVTHITFKNDHDFDRLVLSSMLVVP